MEVLKAWQDKLMGSGFGVTAVRDRNYFNSIYLSEKGNVVFEVVGNGFFALLVPYNKNENIPIHINKNQLKNLVDGELVIVNVGTEKEHDEYLGEIVKVIGHKDDANMDINLISKYKEVLI